MAICIDATSGKDIKKPNESSLKKKKYLYLLKFKALNVQYYNINLIVLLL